MSIIATGISYAHPGRDKLFENLSFTLHRGEKASLVGDNGTGKSTLLRILSGQLPCPEGEFSVGGSLYMVPQHFGQYDRTTAARAAGIGSKLDALHAILSGDPAQKNYDLLGDDWDIGERFRHALDHWGVGWIGPDTPLGRLSGGEKTRVFLAGMTLQRPAIVLMDEPTNHLDRPAREKLCRWLAGTGAAVLAVSHDRELLEAVDLTYELNPQELRRYGGNYTFYRQQKEAETGAVRHRIAEREKELRAVRRTAAQAMERKQRQDVRGERKSEKAGTPRIMMDTLRDSAEKSGSRIREKHARKMEETQADLRELRGRLDPDRRLKIGWGPSDMHRGKTLVAGKSVNFAYIAGENLWKKPIDFRIGSGERVAVRGPNGSGKTTFVELLTRRLRPSEGEIDGPEFRFVRLDQDYSIVEPERSVLGQVERYNLRNLPEHALRTELHRFLFPSDAWDKPCGALSGGEKMRLALCCLFVSDDAPQMLVLDEPTNNLDLRSMEILTRAVRDYRGTVLAITHDPAFAEEVGIDRFIDMNEYR